MLEKIKINLRKPNLCDLPLLVEWMSSSDYTTYLLDMSTNSSKDMQEIIEYQINNSNVEPPLDFMYIAETATPFGLIIFNDTNWRSRFTTLSVLIGKENIKYKIFGIKLFFSALELAFDHLNMNKVMGFVYEFNNNVIRLMERFGGHKEVSLKNYVERGSKRYTAYIYSFFRKDFENFKSTISKFY